MSLTTDNIDFVVPMWTTAGVAATGLDTGAFTITLKEPDGDAVTGLTVAEIGSGLYRLTKAAAWGVAGVWSAQVAHAGAQTTPGAIEIETPASTGDPLESAVPGAYADGTAGAALGLIDDIKAKTDQIGTGIGTVAAPVASSGRVTIYQGKDYNNTDSTALEWTSTSTLALDTVGTTVSFDMVGEQFTGVITGSSGAWTIRVNLTAAQTAALPVGDSPYELVAVLASGRTPPPLAVGTVTVKQEV